MVFTVLKEYFLLTNCDITIASTETNNNQKIRHYPAPIEPVREVGTRVNQRRIQ